MKFLDTIRRMMIISVFCLTSLISQTLHSTFPDANGSVFAIVSSGTTVFVGGSFTTIGGISRNGLAAVNSSTGAVLSWNPNPDRDGGGALVRTLSLSSDGNSLFVGGMFSTIGGQTRHHLAKIDKSTGTADALWDPDVNEIEGVEKMSVSAGDTVYFYGKNFTAINNGTVDRPSHAAAVKGTGTGEATAFNPDGFIPTTTRYIQISPDGSTVYLGYNSLDVTWSGQTRKYFAALNSSDGSVTAMDPGFNQGIFCSAIAGNAIYFGGQFTSISGSFDIQKIAKFDASGGWSNPSLMTTWNNTTATTPDGDIRAVCYSSSGPSPLLYISGGFHSIGDSAREKVAAIRASDAVLQPWNLSAVIQGNLNMRMHLSTSTQKIYIADFTTSILGTSRSFLSAVDGGTDPLPVELTSFTGAAKGNNTELRWKTAAEVNNYGFVVERKEIQGSGQNPSDIHHQPLTTSWVRVGFVEGNGTSNNSHEYTFTECSLSAGTYSFRLKQIDHDGRFKYSAEVSTTVGEIPGTFTLLQNYPNPFNPVTEISFTVPVTGRAKLYVINSIGQEIVSLFDRTAESGSYYRTKFNASNLTSGVYFSILEYKDKRQIKKMLLLK